MFLKLITLQDISYERISIYFTYARTSAVFEKIATATVMKVFIQDSSFISLIVSIFWKYLYHAV